jgi:hypothetical protein
VDIRVLIALSAPAYPSAELRVLISRDVIKSAFGNHMPLILNLFTAKSTETLRSFSFVHMIMNPEICTKSQVGVCIYVRSDGTLVYNAKKRL